MGFHGEKALDLDGFTMTFYQIPWDINEGILFKHCLGVSLKKCSRKEHEFNFYYLDEAKKDR